MTVATLLLVIAPEPARQMEAGLEEPQFVVLSDVVDSVIHPMDVSISRTIRLEVKPLTHATQGTIW